MLKSLRYQRHRENGRRSIDKEVMPTGLKVKMNPTLQHISDGIELNMWVVLNISAIASGTR